MATADVVDKANVIYRLARTEDCEAIIDLVQELAEYEKLTDQLKLTPEQLRKDGFETDHPFYGCVVAEEVKGSASTLIGYALYYFVYSTFQGRSIYLEDVYVTPKHRGKGVGSNMLKKLAQVALEKECVRLDFIVLNWNKSSLDYYVKRGATDLTIKEKWHLHRIEKDGLIKLASS